MSNEKPTNVWLGSKYVATPNELEAQHEPFTPAVNEEVENTDFDDIEAEDSTHREIKEIENEVPEEVRQEILQEVHAEHNRRFQKDETIGKDINSHDKVEAAVKKRWNDSLKESELKNEVEEILNADSNGPSGDWSTLSPEDKSGFFEAKKVQDIIDVLKGKKVVQRWFRNKK